MILTDSESRACMAAWPHGRVAAMQRRGRGAGARGGVLSVRRGPLPKVVRMSADGLTALGCGLGIKAA